MIHELKCWPPYYYFIYQGIKTFELRNNDRNFQTGDMIVLKEYQPNKKIYTGREMILRITFMLTKYPGLENGYVIFQFNILNPGSGKNVTLPDAEIEEA